MELAVRSHDRKLLRADARTLISQFRTRYVPRDRFLTEAEFSALLEALPATRRLWLLLAVFAGPRKSELEALRWEEHVNLDTGWVMRPGTKTKKSRQTVPIADSLRGTLATEWQPTGPVVSRWLNARRDLAAACRRAGIRPVSANDLRRTFASWMKQRGVDSIVVARLMGHTSSAMVERVYGHLNDTALSGPVNALPSLEQLSSIPLTRSCIPVTESGVSLRQERLLRQVGYEKFQQLAARPEGVEPPTFGFEVRSGAVNSASQPFTRAHN